MSDRSQLKIKSVLVLFIVCVLLFVGVVSAVPISKFTADPQIGEAPLTVTFAETSGDATIVNWQWDFGDGTAILEGRDSKPFTHVYETAGEYTATLTVADEKGEKASASQRVVVTVVKGTLAVLTWDENKIIVNYNIDNTSCMQGCFLKILHDDYGYPICWFDFDISNKLKGTIETAPIEARMEIKRYNWYVTIEPKENRMSEFEEPSKIKLPEIFKLTVDKMPKLITADPRYKK